MKNEFDTEKNSWLSWSNHVLLQLENDSKCLSQIKREVNDVKVEIAALKVKSGFWGLIGGCVPVVLAVGLWILKKYLLNEAEP